MYISPAHTIYISTTSMKTFKKASELKTSVLQDLFQTMMCLVKISRLYQYNRESWSSLLKGFSCKNSWMSWVIRKKEVMNMDRFNKRALTYEDFFPYGKIVVAAGLIRCIISCFNSSSWKNWTSFFLQIQSFYYSFFMWSSFKIIFVKDSKHFMMQAEKRF